MTSSGITYLYSRELGVFCAALGAICGAGGDVLVKFASRLSIVNNWYRGHHPLRLIGLTLSSCIEPLFIVLALTFIPAAVAASFVGFRCFSHLIASRLFLKESLSNQHILASLLILFGIVGVIQFGTFDLIIVSHSSPFPLSPLQESLASPNWILFVTLHLACLSLALWLFTTSIRKESSTISSINLSVPIDHIYNTNQDSTIPGLFEIETSNGSKPTSTIVPPSRSAPSPSAHHNTHDNQNAWNTNRSSSQDGLMVFTSGVIRPSTKSSSTSARNFAPSFPQSSSSPSSFFSSIRQFWCRPTICVPYFIGRCSRSPSLLLFGSAVTPGLFGSLSYLIGDVTLKAIYSLGLSSSFSNFHLIVLSLLAIALGVAFGITLKISSDLYDAAVVVPICHGTLIAFTVIGSWSLWTTQSITSNALTSSSFTMFMLSALSIIWGIGVGSRADLMAQISRLTFAAAELTESTMDLELGFGEQPFEGQSWDHASPPPKRVGKNKYESMGVMMSPDDDDVEQYIDELEETLREMESPKSLDNVKPKDEVSHGSKGKKIKKMKEVDLCGVVKDGSKSGGRYAKLVDHDGHNDTHHNHIDDKTNRSFREQESNDTLNDNLNTTGTVA